jgi:putative transcription factor
LSECHICGSEAVGSGVVEGSRVELCNRCARFAGKFEFFHVYEEDKKGAPALQSRPRPPRKEFVLVDDYARKIAKARESKGWTRKQLANRLLIREIELDSFEDNKIKPTEDVAKKLEFALGIALLVAPQEEALDEEDRKKISSRGGGAFSLADVVTVKKKK